jgi:hypothetical protein
VSSRPALLTPSRRRKRARRRARRLLVLALVASVVVTGVVVWITGNSSPSAGYDISSPQCSRSFPPSPLFGIVGVNGGLANNANPCLRGEFGWARGAPGQTRPAQPAVSFYLVTANPGAHHVADWPSGGIAPGYGACNGLLTNACSYLYGDQRGKDSFDLAAGVDTAAARTAPWWLDVELGSSWAGTYALNVAALRGFVDGLRTAGATGPIGIYSTGAQWKDITGLTAQTTRSAFGRRLTDWVAGAVTATIAQARQNCAGGGFTGPPPTLAQYRIGRFDADLRCTVAPG